MTFLGITGEVICPAFENAPALADRVFLRPSWLVDVMKELVRHDLREHLQALDSATMSNAAQIRSLGQQFLSTGVLDRQLRPWLWRELQPTIVHDEAQMDFLVELMEHFGLLVAVPGSDPQQWMLPMRLPERNMVLATATARGAFASFLVRMELAAHADAEVATLASAIEPIADAQIVPRDALRNGCEIAYRKADAVLDGRTRDGNGLNREQIAAINYYTQEFMSPTDPYAKVNVYYPMNVALRSQEIERVRPFWAYIELLQPALLQLPPSAVPAGLFRGLNGPQPPIEPEEERQRMLRAEPTYWWAFTSTSTVEATARMFAQGLPPNDLPKVVFSVRQEGCQARDIMQYSHIPGENELLMPCGSAFATESVEEEPDGTLVVKVQQTEAVLLQRLAAEDEAEQQNRAHRHPALTELAELLDAEGTAVDSAGHRFDFRQPLPGGLLAVVPRSLSLSLSLSLIVADCRRGCRC